MPKSTTIYFHYPKEAEVANIVDVFRLNDRQAADVSRLLCDLVSSLRALEAARESFNTSAPRSQVLARLHRIQAALSEAAEELRGADQRTALLLTFACDYRDSTRQRNARIKTFLKDTFVLDSWRPLTPGDAPYQGPLELLHDLPEAHSLRRSRQAAPQLRHFLSSL